MGAVRPDDRLLITPFLLAVIAIASLGAIWLIFNPAVGRQRELNREMRRLDGQLADLQQRRAQLLLRQNTLLYDSEALEREVRRLGYVRPGEVAFVLTPPADVAARINDAHVPPVQSAGWIHCAIGVILGLLAASLAALAAGCLLEGRLRAG